MKQQANAKTNSKLKIYYELTKPGIIYGNLLTTAGGFLLAAKGHIKFGLLLAVLSGTAFVIASACVFNNYIDREIDKRMARTKKRALVSGLVSGRNAIVYATVLVIIGIFLLALYTNWLTLAIGLVGFFVYIVLYGLSKRRSVYGTIIGSVSGSMPPIAGYTAVTHRFDAGAVILLLILTFWQMPHFYAIAMYRYEDYKSANLPVWPVKKGMRSTKIQILLYVLGFILAASLLTFYRYTGYTYLVIMSILGLAWLRIVIRGFTTVDDKLWARKVFLFSLIIILAQSVMMSIGPLLP